VVVAVVVVVVVAVVVAVVVVMVVAVVVMVMVEAVVVLVFVVVVVGVEVVVVIVFVVMVMVELVLVVVVVVEDDLMGMQIPLVPCPSGYSAASTPEGDKAFKLITALQIGLLCMKKPSASGNCTKTAAQHSSAESTS